MPTHKYNCIKLFMFGPGLSFCVTWEGLHALDVTLKGTIFFNIKSSTCTNNI